MRHQNLRSQLKLLAPTAVVATLLAVGACNSDRSTPTSAISASAPSDAALKARDEQYDTDGDGRLSDLEKAVRKAAKEAEKRAFKDLVKDWKAYKEAVKHGNIRGDLLRCEPQQRQVKSERIGPRGGKIDIGRNKLLIPAGALDQEVVITATLFPGNVAEIEFEPQGLQFARPVQLDMNYDHCIVPLDYELGIVYVDNGFHFLELRPTYDDDELKLASAWIDHFSGYALATGRQ